MEFESLNQRIHRIYNTFYDNFLSARSAEDVFVQAGVPLDGEVANNPTTRRCIELYLKTDKILTKFLAFGFTFLIVPLALCRDIMYYLYCLFLELVELVLK